MKYNMLGLSKVGETYWRWRPNSVALVSTALSKDVDFECANAWHQWSPTRHVAVAMSLDVDAHCVASFSSLLWSKRRRIGLECSTHALIEGAMACSSMGIVNCNHLGLSLSLDPRALTRSLTSWSFCILFAPFKLQERQITWNGN